jgi:hypothetical protein
MMANKAFAKRTFEFGIRCVRLIETLPREWWRKHSAGSYLEQQQVSAQIIVPRYAGGRVVISFHEWES